MPQIVSGVLHSSWEPQRSNGMFCGPPTTSSQIRSDSLACGSNRHCRVLGTWSVRIHMPTRGPNRRFGQGRRMSCGKRPPSHAFSTICDFNAASVADIVATDDLGATVLHKASREGNLKVLMAALHRVPVSARAAFANARTKPDAGRTGLRTALHEAALRGDTRTATCLLVHGARLNLRDGHGRTALEIWARMGHPVTEISSVISLLGVAHDAQNSSGK